VPGRPDVFACGDAAAVPDLERPGQYTPMTAQHAWRQGKTAGHNVAASLGIGDPCVYRHRDMGFVVDLGGVKAAANPLGVHLSGPLAGAVTRGYHLAAMPGNRVRVAADWFLDAVLPRQGVQLGLVRSWSVPLDTASPELARVAGGHERRGASGGAGGSSDSGSGGPGESGGPGAPGARGTAGAPAAPKGSPVRDPGNRPAPTSHDSAVPDPGRPAAVDPDDPASSAPGNNPPTSAPDKPAAPGPDSTVEGET
jgi:NADH dehydrogenase